MRKLLSFLLLSAWLALSPGAARADGIYNPGSNSVGDFQGIDNPASGAAAYVGPGDVKTGWYLLWGTRAYSSATRGNKLVNLCNSTGGTDVLCADASSSVSTGQLVVPSSLTSFCPGANCTIATFYELTGNANCSGACDFVQAAVATRVIYTANALGTSACGVSDTTKVYSISGGGSINSLSQPFTLSGVAKYTTTPSGSNYFFGSSSAGAGTGLGASGASFAGYASTVITGAASGTSAQSLVLVANGASSFVGVNGSSGSTANAGTTALFGQSELFRDAFGDVMGGAVCEVGIYPAAFSGTDVTNMYNNQHGLANGYNY
jgi:hypothetical protein